MNIYIYIYKKERNSFFFSPLDITFFRKENNVNRIRAVQLSRLPVKLNYFKTLQFNCMFIRPTELRSNWNTTQNSDCFTSGYFTFIPFVRSFFFFSLKKLNLNLYRRTQITEIILTISLKIENR